MARRQRRPSPDERVRAGRYHAPGRRSAAAAILNRFTALDDAIAEANRLPYALAAYGWARNGQTIATLRTGVRSGMISINYNGLGLPEVPFAGMLDSGFGDEGGPVALREMMFSRFVSVRGA